MRKACLVGTAIVALAVAGEACGGKKRQTPANQTYGFMALTRLHGPSSLTGEILLASGRFERVAEASAAPSDVLGCVASVPGPSLTIGTADVLVAGTAFTVTGPAGAVVATLFLPAGYYSGEGALSAWVPAASYQFDVPGGAGVGAFQATTTAVSDFTLTAPALSPTSEKAVFSVSGPIALAWTSTGGTDLIRGGVEELDSAGVLVRSAACTFADTGSATIPVSAIAGFHDDSASGWIHRFVLAKYRIDVAKAPKLGPIDVETSAEWILPAYATP